MALVDDRGARVGDGRGGDPGQFFDRQPPQDITAEQSVLGGMLLSKDAIADVVEVLRPGDFYRPAHQSLFDTVLDLYGRGEPADAVTVSAELERRGELLRVGGAPYLHTLISTVPTAANAGYYAEIVAEKAVLRRLVEAGTRIVQLGYHGSDGADVDEVVDRAQAAVYEVTERRMSEDYVALEELLQPTLDEIDAIASRGGASAGVPTGFVDLDAVTNGLHPGQMVIIAARPGIGKALALDTPLPTPTGWTTMGAVAVGEELLGADGRPTPVVAVTDVLSGRPCYEVEFSDGSIIVADGQHQWLTETRSAPRWAAQHSHLGVRTTEEIAATLWCDAGDRQPNHSVPHCLPLDLPDRELPLPPYSLGVWLASREGPDDHIPVVYLRASAAQRRALLAGLLDAEGHVVSAGWMQCSVRSARLALDVRELVTSLGYRGEVHGQTITFSAEDELLRSEHQWPAPEPRGPYPSASLGARHIVDVRPVGSVPVRCVQVGAGDHLYLAGQTMIPTHNSTLGLDFARSCSVAHGMASVIFSLEMSRTEIVMRLLSAEAGIRLADMRSGRMSDDDWTRLARRMGEISEAPLFIDDSPNMTMMEIRAKARRLKQRNDLRLIVVDYMQLMTSGKRVESRQQEVSEFSRHLKLLAKELEVPVVTISQLNRGPEQRTDKKPMLADLRESGCLTRETTLLRADTGAPVTFGALLDHGHADVLVWSMDEQRRLVAAPVTNVFPSGVKNTFRLILASGREITASGNHQFLTFNGWVALDDLAVDDRLAVPRHIPAPIAAGLGWSENQIGLLAHLIGDGCVLRKQPVHYTSQDEENLAFVDQAAFAEFGITARRVRQGNWQHTYLPAPWKCARGRRNPLHTWLRELGIENLRSYEKRIPDALYQADDEEIGIFLHHLWATDGCIFLPTEHSSRKSLPRVYYSTSSRALADGVSRLLARLGIPTRIYQVKYSKSERPGWHVIVAGSAAMRRFCSEIGVHGQRGNFAHAYLERAEVKANTNVDTLPREVWDLVKTERMRVGLTERQFQAAIGTNYCGSTLYNSCLSRERLMRCADALDSEVLRQVGSDDVFWDKVASIEPCGPQPVYDATVKGTHNFIADGIVAHNSLEQDADMVMLIHRPDAWERDDPRAGEADLILAKHRNGPTTTVTVAHQLHYSRFFDMAQN